MRLYIYLAPIHPTNNVVSVIGVYQLEMGSKFVKFSLIGLLIYFLKYWHPGDGLNLRETRSETT